MAPDQRLEEEATSFVELVDKTRRELAEQYLGRLHLSLDQRPICSATPTRAASSMT
jgi:hypothetical protein